MNDSFMDSLADELQQRLDVRNEEALLELNKQIDQLATIPLNKLPPYDDTLEVPGHDLRDSVIKLSKSVESLVDGLSSRNSPEPFEIPDLSFQLRQDVAQFNDLASSQGFHQVHIPPQDNGFLSASHEEYSFNISGVEDHAGMSMYESSFPSFTQDTEALLAQADAMSEDEKSFEPIHFDPLPSQPEEHYLRESRPEEPIYFSQTPRSEEQYIRSQETRQLLETKPELRGLNDRLESIQNATSFQLSPMLSNDRNDRRGIPEVEPNRGLGHLPADENSRAVVNALRTLQERVGKLESDKTAAKEKINDLEKELSTTRKLLYHNSASQTQTGFAPPRPRTAEPTRAETSLTAISDKETLSNIEAARQKVSELKERVARVRDLSRERTKLEQEYQTKFKPIESFLESEEGFYPAEQGSKYPSRPMSAADKSFLTENEITRLQREIEAERIVKATQQQLSQRDELKLKLISKLQTNPSILKKKKTKKSQKIKNPESEPVWKRYNGTRGQLNDKQKSETVHVRKRPPVDMPFVVEQTQNDRIGREMPFIVGQNIGKSFSVTANLQRVFSLLKAHNPALCTICSHKQPCRAAERERVARSQSRGRPVHVVDAEQSNGLHRPGPSRRALSAKGERVKDEPFVQVATDGHLGIGVGVSETHNLKLALSTLEDEFKELKLTYNDYVEEYEKVAESMTSKRITEAAGAKTLKAIGDDLRLVIQNMETKGDQISILREIIQSSIMQGQRADAHKHPDTFKPKLKRYQLHTITSLSRSKEPIQEREREPTLVRSNSVVAANAKAGLSNLKSSLREKDDRGRSSSRDPHWEQRNTSPGRTLASLSLLKSSFKVQDALVEQH